MEERGEERRQNGADEEGNEEAGEVRMVSLCTRTALRCKMASRTGLRGLYVRGGKGVSNGGSSWSRATGDAASLFRSVQSPRTDRTHRVTLQAALRVVHLASARLAVLALARELLSTDGSLAERLVLRAESRCSVCRVRSSGISRRTREELRDSTAHWKTWFEAARAGGGSGSALSPSSECLSCHSLCVYERASVGEGESRARSSGGVTHFAADVSRPSQTEGRSFLVPFAFLRR